MPQMNGVISVSHSSLASAQSLYDFQVPTVVVTNGISPDRMSVSEKRAEVRSRHDTGPDDSVLLYVGSLEPAKRPDRFIRLVKAVTSRVENTKGWIVGDGPLRASTERLVKRLGLEEQVLFLGTRDDVANLMAAADILVVTSDTEGIPATVLEARFLGLPVVATDVGGLKECVLDGVTGFLTGTDVEELERAVLRLLSDDDLRATVGGKAREASSSITIETVATLYLDFYRQIVNSSDERSPKANAYMC